MTGLPPRSLFVPGQWRQGVWARLAALHWRLRDKLTLVPRAAEKGLLFLGALAHRWQPGPRTFRLALPGSTAEWFVSLDPRDALRRRAVCRALTQAGPLADDCLLVLVRYRRAPLLAGRADAEVRSWAAPVALLPHLPPPSTPLLTLLDAVLRLPAVQVRVVQVGARAPKTSVGPPAPPPATAWVVPHRGAAPWLAECLARVGPQLRLASGDEALVCLDEAPTAAIRTLQTTFPTCWFGVLARPGVGPFVARQRAVERTACARLLFQDSDDVPTADRADRLHAALDDGRQLDAVGSHELRLDYLADKVVAVRFPLDASRALRVAMGHPVLFPTLLIRREQLLAVGGFATTHRFALDTQLLLRASFTWRLGNVDAFLYLRRRRAGSLTTDPATAFGTPVREALRRDWKRDFAAVRNGQLALADSSLAPFRGAEYVGNELRPLADA